MKAGARVAALLVLVSCAGSADVVAPPVVAPVVELVAPTASQPCDDRLPPAAVATEHVPAVWQFDVQRYTIDVSVDPEHRAISGSVTVDVDDAADGLKELVLDAVGLEIARVDQVATGSRGDVGWRGHHPVPFTYDGRALRVRLDGTGQIGTRRIFRIEYSGRPARGLYFNDGDFPQVYTQGEAEDSRYWFPCHDFPDDRAYVTVRVAAPRGWDVIGQAAAPENVTYLINGVPEADLGIHRFGVPLPHVAYLTSLVAGDYEVSSEHGVVPLEFVVEKRDAPYAAFDFRKTNDVLKFFGDYTGLPYPYPKYSQTCVRHFMFGGMENISATTLADSTIHPPDWEPARSSTSLVAHEAAHQWFGDWITCSDWSHCWLNEGFATYFDALFTEHDEGRDAFLWTLRGIRHGALGAMDGKRRAVVSNVYADPFDLFDGHAYPGGAARLHMLRHLLGDEQFKGAIRHYVKKCGLQCVRTEDFKAALEEYSGQDLGWFFDQWFMKPGYPVLKVRWTWDEAKKAEIVTVEQTQKAEGGVPEAYRLPLEIRLFEQVHDGYVLAASKRLDITKRSATFEIPLALDKAPGHVEIDPDTALLARFDLDQVVGVLRNQMLFDANPALRFDAAEALAAIVRDDKRPAGERDDARDALLRNAQYEKIAPVRAAFMGQMAVRKDDPAAQALIDAMNGDADLRVRLAASDALHGFDGDVKALDAIARHLNDDNDLMRAAAVAGIAKLKHPQAFDLLLAQVERPGWQSVVRVAALKALADLGDERAFATLVRFAAPGDDWSRGVAIEGLGRMGRKKPEYRDAVLPYLDDRERHVRQRAAEALGHLADPDTIGVLVEHFKTETWTPVKDALRNAVKACRAAAVEEGRLVSVESVRASAIRDRHVALRDEAAAVEKSIASLAGDAKTDAETKLKSLRDQMAQAQRDLDDLGVPVKPKPPVAK